MSYEFTKLPEVAILDNLTENAHLIVEDGGKTRRFPASEFSGGDTVLDENGKLMQNVLPEGYPYIVGSTEYFLIEETTHNFEDYQWEVTSPLFEIEIGKTYIVVWDGVEYECVTKNQYESHIWLGDGTAISLEPDESKPFCIANIYGRCFVYTPHTGMNHTFSVKWKVQDIQKMSKDFLPDGVVTEDKFAEYVVGVKFDGNNEIFNDYDNNTATSGFAHAEGTGTKANGFVSHAEGRWATASGECSHAEGQQTTASGNTSHAEGLYSTASGTTSHAEGYNTVASGLYSHAEGWGTTASQRTSHAEGESTVASANFTHAEGHGTLASSLNQHVQGRYNIEDTAGTYAHIVGNGTSDSSRSNAHTIDWSGNGWFAGTIEGTALILKSANGTRYQITVSDTGELTASALA